MYQLSFCNLVCCMCLISAAFVLPSRESLCLGDRVITYLPRCADTNSEVRKISAEVSEEQTVACGLVEVDCQ